MLVVGSEKMRAKVGPAEVVRIERFGLCVGGKRFSPKSVDIVGHSQTPSHQGGSRGGADA